MAADDLHATAGTEPRDYTADALVRGGGIFRTLDDAVAEIGALRAGGPAGGPPAPAAPRVPPRSNCLAGDEHHDAIGEALGAVAAIVGRTAGPHGSAAIVLDPSGAHLATKDGYTVLKNVQFVQWTARMVCDVVRSAARSVVRRVGDGSTTSVLMAASLYRSFRAARLGAFPPGAVQAAMSGCADLLAAEVARRASPAEPGSPAMLAVATIAANNDPGAGAVVAGIYGRYGRSANVFVGTSPTSETTAEAVPGFRVSSGMADSCMANEAPADGAAPSVCSLGASRVMVWGGHMTEREFLLGAVSAFNIAAQAGEAFVLVAAGFDPKVVERVRAIRKSNPEAPVLLVDHAMATRRARGRLGDLAAVLDADYVEPGEAPLVPSFEVRSPEAEALRRRAYEMCGVAQAVRSTQDETTFITGDVWPAALARAEEAEATADRLHAGNNSEALSEEIEELRARARAIRGTEVALLAGGDSEQEKAALRDLLEDAALACAAALRTGTVEGLGLTALRALHDPASRLRLEGELAALVEAKTRIGPGPAAALASLSAGAAWDAYESVLDSVFANARIPFGAVLERCLREGLTFDLAANGYRAPGESGILVPAATDIEVVRGAMSIASLLATSSQTLLLHPAAGGGQD